MFWAKNKMMDIFKHVQSSSKTYRKFVVGAQKAEIWLKLLIC